jgi:hypothetical protein
MYPSIDGGGGWVLRVESERVMLCCDRKRVVAVFAHGAKWQFQGYPWPTPAQIFDNSKPAHPIASGLLFLCHLLMTRASM